ncbi:MAG: hypothetical protein JWN85_684 [Gammaproteobacteria bacterium]|nr:hypothetical protein [Gammaproteobacteria bacterium]
MTVPRGGAKEISLNSLITALKSRIAHRPARGNRYVDELDPLQVTLRTGEFEESSTYHFQNDLDRMKKALERLSWARARVPCPHAFKEIRARQEAT